MASTSSYGGSGYIAAKIGASDSLLLVDSGATLSVIPKQLWLDLTKGGSELVGHQGDVSAANGGGGGEYFGEVANRLPVWLFGTNR